MRYIALLTLLAISAMYAECERYIFGGYIAKRKQFPYIVFLEIKLSGIYYNWCGGALISDRFVLSAAHCFNRPNVTYVHAYLGAWNWRVGEEKGRVIDIAIRKSIKKHEDYVIGAPLHDIALLQIFDKVKFTEYIKPIKLPKLGSSDQYENVEAITSGWGLISDTEKLPTDKLRFIRNKVLTNSECLKKQPYITSQQICIQTGGKMAPCPGDSGGPLVLAKGTPTLIGLTSYGHISGCEKDYPAVYTRVSTYLEWIKEHSGVVYL